MRKTLLTLASETAIISGAVFLFLTVPLLFVYPPLFASTELVATFLLRFTLIGCAFVAIGGMGILPAVAESAADWSVFQPIPIGPEIARRFPLTSVSACGRMCLESRERTTTMLPNLQDTLDTIAAIQIVEGSIPSEEDEQLAAWQLLINSGIVWRLQGSYSRGAMALIEQGLVEAHVKA